MRYLALFDAAGQLSALGDAEFIAMLQLMGRAGAVRAVRWRWAGLAEVVCLWKRSAKAPPYPGGYYHGTHGASPLAPPLPRCCLPSRKRARRPPCTRASQTSCRCI